MSVEKRAIHWALDSIQAGRQAVLSYFGYGDTARFELCDMRDRRWRCSSDGKFWWWFEPQNPLDELRPMGEIVVKDDNGLAMKFAHGFLLVFVEQQEMEGGVQALLFDADLREKDE